MERCHPRIRDENGRLLCRHRCHECLQRYREVGVTDFLVLTGQMPLDETGLNKQMCEMSQRFVDTVAYW
jgi:5,10-methylenetetrahydrofolate reductase